MNMELIFCFDNYEKGKGLALTYLHELKKRRGPSDSYLCHSKAYYSTVKEQMTVRIYPTYCEDEFTLRGWRLKCSTTDKKVLTCDGKKKPFRMVRMVREGSHEQ